MEPKLVMEVECIYAINNWRSKGCNEKAMTNLRDEIERDMKLMGVNMLISYQKKFAF